MNSSSLFSMLWPRDELGYELVEFPAMEISSKRSLLGFSGQPFKRVCPKSRKWSYYDPFEEAPELAREFSALPVKQNAVEEDAALNFINRYGLLTMRLPEKGQGETLDGWPELIRSFKKVFNLIDTSQGLEATKVFNQFHLNINMSIEVSSGNSKNKRSLNILPASLYSAMCLMISDEITKGAQLKQCEAPKCANWFPMRSNKKVCSETCRQAKHRSKKR